MNGPESFSQGVPMETKPPKPKWSQEEIDKGEEILGNIGKIIDTIAITDRYAQASISARSLGYLTTGQTFKQLPSGIKSYIEYVWWLASDEGQENLRKKRIQGNLDLMAEDWNTLYEKDPDYFSHAMTHPDDLE